MPDATQILSRFASGDGVAADATWPISDEIAFHDYKLPHLAATFSPDSKLLAVRDEEMGITLRSGGTLEVLRTMPEVEGDVRAVRFSPTQNVLAVGYTDGSLALFDIDRQVEVGRVVFQADVEVCPVRFSRDGRRLLIIAGNEGEERWCAVYSTDDLDVIAPWSIPSANLVSAILLPDGETAIVGYEKAHLWPLRDLDKPTILPSDARGGEELDVSPDGKYLVSDAGLGRVSIVEVATGKIVDYLVGHRTHISSLQFSPDGTRIATAGHGTESVKIWDFASRRELVTLQTEGWYHRQVEWSPDGNAIALIGGAGRLSLWRVPSLDEIEARERQQE